MQSMSCSADEIDAILSGKSVALVGNARRLGSSGQGAEIDSADLVIRINSAPMPSPESHGSRTDILALAVKLSTNDLERIRPSRIFWMSHKRKRLTWSVASTAGFFLPSLRDFHALKEILGAPPSTGLMTIDQLSRSQARSIALYGFDFFASLSLSGHRTAAQVPHNFVAEQQFVDSLLVKDPRFRLIRAT